MQGNADAQKWIGHLHEHGLGVRRDTTVAVRWYREAAERGHLDAQRRIPLAAERGGARAGYDELRNNGRHHSDKAHARILILRRAVSSHEFVKIRLRKG